jgi:hypothetical protein
VLLASLAGCSWLIPFALMQEHKRKVPAEFARLEGKRTLVTVWAPPETLFDYPRVRLELTSFIVDKLKAEVKSIHVVDPVKVEDHIQRTLSVDVDPQRLGRQFGVDMVVYLELLEFHIRDPHVPDLVQARIRASVQVYDLTADADEPRSYELTSVDITEPESGPQLMTQANVVQVRRAAYVKFAEAVARKFYTWEEIIE